MFEIANFYPTVAAGVELVAVSRMGCSSKAAPDPRMNGGAESIKAVAILRQV